MSMSVAAPRTVGRWRLMPARGTLSLFELVLLAAFVAFVAVRLPQNLQDVVVLTFLWAGGARAWNHARGESGVISFGPAAVFGIGA